MEITNEKDIAERIINLINELHPVKKPRVDLNMPSFKSPSMDILINIIEEDNMPHTFISILDGTENFKQSVPNGNILTDAFLEIRITDLKLQNKLKEYLIFILSTYYAELKQTPYWQETIEKYKKKMLFEMEYEYIMDFVSHLSEEEIRKLLVNITNERFIEIMNNMVSKETKLERLKP